MREKDWIESWCITDRDQKDLVQHEVFDETTGVGALGMGSGRIWVDCLVAGAIIPPSHTGICTACKQTTPCAIDHILTSEHHNASGNPQHRAQTYPGRSTIRLYGSHCVKRMILAAALESEIVPRAGQRMLMSIICAGIAESAGAT